MHQRLANNTFEGHHFSNFAAHGAYQIGEAKAWSLTVMGT